MQIAMIIAESSKAQRKKVGAVLVKDNNIIAIGYNGTPSGYSNICEVDNITVPEVLHAESNAISKCLQLGISTKNSIMYATMSPCFQCCKLIIQARIKEVYYYEQYRETTGLKFLKENNIKVYQVQ